MEIRRKRSRRHSIGANSVSPGEVRATSKPRNPALDMTAVATPLRAQPAAVKNLGEETGSAGLSESFEQHHPRRGRGRLRGERGELSLGSALLSTITTKKRRPRSQPPSQHTRQPWMRSPSATGARSRRNLV